MAYGPHPPHSPRRHKRRAAKGEEVHGGVYGVRVLPLGAQCFPVFRLYGPVLGGGVRRLREQHEDHQIEGNESRRRDREHHGGPVGPYGDGVSDIGQEGEGQQQTQNPPAAVDLLHGEVFGLWQVDLVQEFEGMRSRRDERKPGYDDGKEPHTHGNEPLLVPVPNGTIARRGPSAVGDVNIAAVLTLPGNRHILFGPIVSAVN